MAKLTLSLERRTVSGKKVKTLRKQGIIPANVYGKKIESTAAQVRSTQFRPILLEAGETQIVYLRIGEEKDERPVLITDTQRDPVTDEILHIDFRQVDLKEKITANIPVEIIGESLAVRDLAASLITSISEIEVEALPQDLPENFSVDVSGLANIGDTFKVADLSYNRDRVEIKVDPETIIVSVAEQQKEEAAPAPVPEVVEGEAPAAAAEGEAKPAVSAGKPAEEPKKE